MAFAGDCLTFESVITDIYDKKNGLLEFIDTESTVHNQDGDLVCVLSQTVVVRKPGGAQ